MLRNTVQIPVTNRETLARARFRSRITFNVIAKFDGKRQANLGLQNIQKMFGCFDTKQRFDARHRFSTVH